MQWMYEPKVFWGYVNKQMEDGLNLIGPVTMTQLELIRCPCENTQ